MAESLFSGFQPTSSVYGDYLQRKLAERPEAIDTGAGLSSQDYYSSLDPSAQQKSIADYIRLAMEQGQEDISRQYAPMYEQLQSEQAAMGRRGSPVSLASTGRLRSQQGQSITDLIRGLMQKRAELQYGAAAKRPEQMLAGAQTFGNLGLAGQRLGQERQQFGVGTIANEIARLTNQSNANRGFDFNVGQLAQQGALNREKAAAEGRANLENRTSFGEGLIGSSISGLAGGVGGALTGYGLSKIPKSKQTPA